MADPFIITNRRQLLTGVGAVVGSGALTAGVLFSNPLIANEIVDAVTQLDPACAAFECCTEIEQRLWVYPPEEEAGFYALYRTFINAELTLADTPAESLWGVRGKLHRLAKDMTWREGDNRMCSRLGLSLLRDLDRMTGETGETP